MSNFLEFFILLVLGEEEPESHEMWLEFHECIHKKKGTICKYCHKAYVHPNKIGKMTSECKFNPGGPTTSMSRHLKECFTYKKQQESPKLSINKFTGNDSANSGEDIVSKVLKFSISGNIAFNQAGNLYFQELIQTAQIKAKQ